jgi:transcription elongation factor Elf1
MDLSCYHCGHTISISPKLKPPRPGDVVICGGCLRTCAFAEEMTLRELTIDEQATVDSYFVHEGRELLRRARHGPGKN